MPTYKTPGVYVEEVSTLPPSVAEVSTAIPAFIGYTEKSPADTPVPYIARISTFLEYKELFGGPAETTYAVTMASETVATVTPAASPYQMYYGMDLYFKNGGGPCYIVSTGAYEAVAAITYTALKAGLDALEKKDEPTLIVVPEAVTITEYCDIYNDILAQCHKLGDRFGIFDVLDTDTDAAAFRQGIRTEAEYLKYGAAYTPYLLTSITHAYSDGGVSVTGDQLGSYQTDANGINVIYAGSGTTPTVTIAIGAAIGFEVTNNPPSISITVIEASSPADIKAAWEDWKKTAGNITNGYEINVAGDGSVAVGTADASTNSMDGAVTLKELKIINTAMYNNILTALSAQKVTLPPAAAMAGIYATTDRNRGVWKAPANVSVVSVTEPTQKITDEAQENLNVDATAGKSVNAIRLFTGKGILVWGARTLAGNDNEWRYISTRRLFNTVEESCQQSTQFAVFEPNDSNTWLKVKSMIDSYLYGLWQQGALFGSKPEEAYFVNVGLGKTMTSQDILEGRMIMEVGLAAVRPAEFIILRFSHKLQES